MKLTIAGRFKRKAASFVPVGRRSLELERPCLSITIDDFPMNSWTNGGPIFDRYGVKATFYTSGGLCDTVVLGLPQYDARTLVDVHGAGHEIGCHTFDHYNACTVPTDRFIASVERNARFFEETIPDARIRNFAFPYGDMTPRTKYLLSKRFDSCRGSLHGTNGAGSDVANLRCIYLQLNALSRYDLVATLEEAARRRAWVIVLTHDISSDPTEYGCKPEHVVGLIDAANRYDYEILPVGAVLERNLP